MEMVLEPEIYTPSVDDNGTYINHLPSKEIVRLGVRCPCGSRKNMIFKNTSNLNKHFDCEKHKSWLKNLNLNKLNHYNELIKTKEIIDQQKEQLIKLKQEIQEKNTIIINQAKQLVEQNINQNVNQNVTTVNLLELDD